MGIREDQIIGLNPWAMEFVENLKEQVYEEHTIRIYPDGSVKVSDPVQVHKHHEVLVYKYYYGMYDQEHPLYRYTTSEGEVYEEIIQASPWSSGPVIFLALQDANGNMLQSVWTDEEISDIVGV